MLNLKPLFNNAADHDVTISVPDGSFFAHKVLLRAASPYFANIFGPNKCWKESQENKIHFPEMTFSKQFDPLDIFRLALMLEMDEIQMGVLRHVARIIKQCSRTKDTSNFFSDVIMCSFITLSGTFPNNQQLTLRKLQYNLFYIWSFTCHRGTPEQRRTLLSEFQWLRDDVNENMEWPFEFLKGCWAPHPPQFLECWPNCVPGKWHLKICAIPANRKTLFSSLFESDADHKDMIVCLRMYLKSKCDCIHLKIPFGNIVYDNIYTYSLTFRHSDIFTAADDTFPLTDTTPHSLSFQWWGSLTCFKGKIDDVLTVYITGFEAFETFDM